VSTRLEPDQKASHFMKNLRLLPLVLVATALLVAAGCGGGEQTVPADAVAVVDGTVIPKSELESLMARAKKSYESQQRDFPKAGTPEYQSLQTQAVAFLVQREEYEKEAGSLGVEITDEDVDKRVEEVKKQYFAGNQKELEKQIAQQGYTLETFAADIRSQLVSEAIYERVTAEVKTADADVTKYYNENKAQYEVPESREVRHILVKTKAQADGLYAELQGGADFAALAKKHSLDPGSKDAGGKLTITRGQTVAPFDATAFLLKQGQLSKPVKTEFGYHLIEPISAVKPAATTPIAQVKGQIQAQLEEQTKNDAIQEWADEVQKDYAKKVAYATGFAPPDTSSDSDDSTHGG
jgi:parvulin-like peptidyl-prolyl isomerase